MLCARYSAVPAHALYLGRHRNRRYRRNGAQPRAWFETAKQQEPWLGQWIAAPREIANARLVKRFALPGRVVSARLYICGLGLYEAFINGQKAGDEYLAPGCNKYDSWLQYQTYDVTDLLAEDNEIAVLLGDGWYKGALASRGRRKSSAIRRR